VVAKIESSDILHKTEVGGVRLGLRDEAGLRAAFEGLLADAARHRPGARLEGVVVQETGRGTVELVVGLQNDPVFGPVVMVGLGGTLIEVLRDVAFRKAPVSPAEARTMLDELKGARVLDGVRGAPPVDREAVAELVAAASRLGAAAGPRLRELELNPVLAGPDGAVAVDWLLMLDERTPQ
jgi:acetate---CoA ligase (ADP-forming)